VNKYLVFLRTDAFLASYPKSGNTWVRFIVANILKEVFNIDKDVNFENIAYFIPIFPSSINEACNKADKFPVIRKVHFFNYKLNLLSKLYRKKIIYIVRNPFDVLASYYLYSRAEDSIDIDMTLGEFVAKNIGYWVGNVNFFSGISSEVLYYENIKANPVEELQKLRKFLENCTGVKITDSVLKASINNSSRGRMAEMEQSSKSKNNNEEILFDAFMKNKNYNFVNNKESREGIEFSDSDQALIARQIRKITCPELRQTVLGFCPKVV